MSPVDLHALPAGTVIADGEAVAVRYDGVLTRPWALLSGTSTGSWFNAGHLLAMSQDWVVLRHGLTGNAYDGDKCTDCGCDPCIGFTCSGNEPGETRTEWENRMADTGGPY